MFEQATLSNGPASKRVWTTCVGFTGQAILVTGLILAPMIFPQVLPRIEPTIADVFVPRPLGEPHVRPRGPQAPTRQAAHLRPAILFAPTRFPDKPVMLIDELETSSAYVPADVPAGRDTGKGFPDGVDGALTTALTSAPPPRRNEPEHTAQQPASPVTAPPRVGGVVHTSRILHRVEPVYPALAKQTHTSGDVELEGVIAVDGRMIELKVKSGHPLLVKAALDAVSQWIYEPTRLNGVPVEVITTIHVTFRLN